MEAEAQERKVYEAARKRLEGLGRWHDGLEDDVRTYARASVEAERATRATRDAVPGSRQAQVAGAASRQWTRQASVLRNRLGLAGEAKPKASGTLHELFPSHETPEEAEARVKVLGAQIPLDQARMVARLSVGTPYEEVNAEHLRAAEAEHGWVEQ